MNYNKFLMTSVLLGGLCNAQNFFELINVSLNFNVVVNVETCTENKCSGKATIDLYDKNTMRKYHTFFSYDFYLDLNENQKPVFDSLKKSVVLGDFNFDGTEDIAIRNGNVRHENPFYEVYLNDLDKQQFVLNEELTNLVRFNSGMFTTDAERRRIIAYQQNGCCWNLTSEYVFVPEKRLLKVLEFEEDTRDPEKVKTVKREFIDYKWFAKTTIYPRERYYKENENTERN
ncbi:XAC2610-related protein [Chryseobacterium terrae]|uniref:VCBS repeat-containing protein n=1 Tax=Chryseobacterium terrae TaxID=3163299 RepID=A0ABW8Y2H4_9FLAO